VELTAESTHLGSPAPNDKRSSPVERALAAAGVGVMSVGAAAVWYFEPAKSGLFPACALFTMTGFACPGCGLTRGFHALFHGDIAGALGYNALIPLFVAIFGFFFLSMFWLAIRGKGFPKWSVSLPVLYGMLGVLLVFGVVRNLPYYPFTLLFP
jgi:hypothetical protein